MIIEATTYEEIQKVFMRGERLSIHSSRYEESSHDILVLSQLNRILFYEPEEMIVKVQAGITLDELNAALREREQWIPVLSERLETTLGAAIANDRYHPRTESCGALRTAILGGTFMSADGVLFESGSRVVKSVAGYDTHRAFCGSRGLFGAILDVTLKTHPLPEAFFWCDVAEKNNVENYYPTICEQGDVAFCELSGYGEDVEHDRNELLSSGGALRAYDLHQAREKIVSIIEKRPLSAYTDNQLEKLCRVFDPKGILR